MQVVKLAGEIIVGQACWHGPARTMIEGLQASGVAARGVDDDAPDFKRLGLMHPGCILRPQDPRPMAPQTLKRLGLTGRTVPHAGLSQAAAAAVMQDDAQGLQARWHHLSAPERTAMLCCAAAVGAEAVVGACIRWLGRADVADGGCAGNTPLHYAALGGHVGVARLLLAAGAKARALNPVNTEPMHDAARGGHVDVLAQLHRCGVDLSRYNIYGDTLLHRAAEYGCDDVAERYVAVIDFVLAHAACESVLALLNRTNHKGFTALDLATASGSMRVAAALRERGAGHGVLWSSLPEAERTYERVNHLAQWAQVRARLEAEALAA